MANEPKSLTLDEVTDAIIATLQAAFPGVNVKAYPEERSKESTPAILLESDEFEMPAENQRFSGQSVVMVRWKAHCLADGYGDSPARTVRSLAMAVMHKLRDNRCGVGIGAISIIIGARNEFEPDLEDYDLWTVEFTHSMPIGESVWANDPDATPPGQVWVGQTPDIGPDNVDKYWKIAEPPEVT